MEYVIVWTKDGCQKFTKDEWFGLEDGSLLHRLDGPAFERIDGSKGWYVDGNLHRLDGPAEEWADGSKTWYMDGKAHRTDGPAFEWSNGIQEWWINGKQLPTDEIETWLEENDIDLKIDDGQMAFKLMWS